MCTSRLLKKSRGGDASHRGAALLIALAAVVMISMLMVAFLSQASLSRRVSFSSAGQYRADVVAKAGLETIVGDLRTEIRAGSTTYTSNGVSIYLPSINATAVPFRMADNDLPNVLKKSAAASNFWSGSSYGASYSAPIRAASSNRTDTAAIGGRRISSSRWNATYLLGETVPTTFVVPDWVVVTRKGATSAATSIPAVAILANSRSTNQNYAVGRFAYIVYNEGGLLDVNVAGYPSSLGSSDFPKRRGLLPQVNLAGVPGIDTDANANAIVQWRNKTTAMSATSYTNYVFTATSGFATVAPGDQSFLSRKDLIQYAEANPTQIQTKALQYLGTFTRELSAPTFTPSASRKKVQSGYAAVGQDDAFNPSLINIRVTSSFTRDSDGTSAQVGEPLIKYRFPLNRLALLTDTATAGNTDKIYKYFGLTRASSSSPWVYNHGDSSRILKLSEIAGKREPDFFELLQAAISIGSIGQSLNNGFSGNRTADLVADRQIIQIGANIIDQYDADSYPVQISYNSEVFSGIENLPYITRVFETYYSKTTSGRYGAWYQPEIWNPHVQPSSTSSSGPTLFRFVTSGSATAHFYNPQPDIATAANSFASATGLTFSTGIQNFSEPLLLDPTNASASGNDKMVDGTTTFLGIWIGTATGLPYSSTVPYTTAYVQQNVTHQLQYSRNGSWITYSTLRGVVGRAFNNSPGGGYYSYKHFTCGMKSDPRSDRFGMLAGYISPPTTTINQTIRPSTAAGLGFTAGYPSAGDSAWTKTSACLGLLSENKSSSGLRYVDPDGEQRRADGAYTTGSASDGGYPLADDALNNPSSRPIILNRPFRSVAEMGYAFRDQPWKHLDFFTAESGDAALLDAFCLTESPATAATSTDPVPIAGRVDLNSRQQAVLTSVLMGAVKTDESSSQLSSDEATALASNLIALTKAQPLLNQSELVTRWISSTGITGYSQTPADSVIKRRREAAVRALSDIGNVRTWNLLIDVIAQSGRYGPKASSLNDFIVEGERRYWLHVAIDRYTGKVIARYLEPVYE